MPLVFVVAILAAIAIPALQDYRSRSEDRQRVADLAQIQEALDYYHFDHGAYPVSAAQTTDALGFATALNELVSSGYLASLPNDPFGTLATYIYQSTSDGSYYCLGADLSGTPPPSTCDTDTLGDTPGNANYLVGP